LFIQVEKLIKELPTAPSDSSNVGFGSADKGYFGNDTNVGAGTDVRETQSILLERIASENEPAQILHQPRTGLCQQILLVLRNF
jgi:hypothetical protein